MTAKEKHERKIIEYLANPNNKWLNRDKLASKVCGIRKQTLYSHFTPEELQEIEVKSLELRRSQYSFKLSKVDQAVLKQAEKGDTAAAKLAYQRFEGWSEKKEHKVSVDSIVTIIRGDDAKL
jgi:hypothetical protein